MLIDRYLPRFDVTLVEHTIADADDPTTWEALRGLDLAQVHWGRIASNFSLRPYGVRTLISYEVRTVTADAESAAWFTRYWRLIRPFVGHIMRATLDAVRVDAERASRR